MQLTPQLALLQTAHVFQQHLFPRLEAELGTLSPQLQLLSAVINLIPSSPPSMLRRAPTLPTRPRSHRPRHRLPRQGRPQPPHHPPAHRPPQDRLPSAASAAGTAPPPCPTNPNSPAPSPCSPTPSCPSNSTPPLIASTQKDRLIGHIARDSTAIEARERVPEALLEQNDKTKARQTKRKKGPLPKAKAAERGTASSASAARKLDTMLANLLPQCDIGAKRNSRVTTIIGAATNPPRRRRRPVPISALLTSASVHDSQTAIPS
ncbi:MAG: hypothetical protein HS123_04355 [Solibacteraceae bacterium]|nr:hypothetical protein [Solibacteraceae bacterium]